jgi:hypothetical protein
MKKKIQEQINEDALLREVVEDVQNEHLRQIWDKYGLFIIIGIAAVLTVVISFESLKSWQTRKNQELSTAYSAALSLQAQGQLDNSLSIYQALAEKDKGIYGDLALLQIADIYFEQNKKDDAYGVLSTLSKNKHSVIQLRNVAAMKLASYQLDDNVPANEIKELLQPALEDESNMSAAHELLAMLYIREHQFPDAISEYEKVMTSAGASDAMKARAQDMINVLNEQN